MKKQKPLISIVIPSYKAEQYIGRAVKSVLDQEGVSVQIIVVEDGKFDNTELALEKYMPYLDFISLNKNSGACHARNVGLSFAKYDYVMFLDSDDFIEGPLLISLYKTIEIKGASLAFGPNFSKIEGSNKEHIYYHPIEDKNSLAVLIRWLSGRSGPAPCSILWRKSEINRIGRWNESIHINQDGEIIIRAMFNNCTVAYAKEGRGVYWQHNNPSISKKTDYHAFNSLKRIEEYAYKQIISKYPYNRKLMSALNAYRIEVSRRAYRSSMTEFGRIFELRWRQADNILLVNQFLSFKQIVLYNFLFNCFGIQSVERLLVSLKQNYYLYNIYNKIKFKISSILSLLKN